MERLLVTRFSALGDILMTIPVIHAVSRRYPDIEITVASRPYVGSIFGQIGGNVRFLGINPGEYRGLKGLEMLYRHIRDEVNPTMVCDLHDVWRTKYVRTRFHLRGIPVSHVIKDRKARRRFIKSEVKQKQTPVFFSYADAFARLGFPVDIDPESGFSIIPEQIRDGIGIAPFAAHSGKIYPTDMMEKVVSILCSSTRVYLFGAGQKERKLMEEWEARYPNVTSTVGKMDGMMDELRLIGRLKVMLTMDSGNMHLASLAGTTVVSIWGATHSRGGFLGWGQKEENAVQLPMACRPCSTYGNRPCRFGNYPCMTGITPETVAEAVMKVIGK